MERLTPEDLESPKSKERFLADLPPWLFGTVGGNSPCISVELDNTNELIVFDAGSGIRELGMVSAKKNYSKYHIFFSHFHWDHIMGLPFFSPAYNPGVKLYFYSPMEGVELALQKQMAPPHFPVNMDSMAAQKEYHTLRKPMNLMGASLFYRKMNHPGDSYSFKVEQGNHKIIYATDTELLSEDFMRTEENTSYFQDADLIIMDAQYTLGEAMEKYNWGHSAFSFAVDFAANWNIKHVVLFHHDPTYDDHKLHTILQSAKWYMERLNVKDIKLSLALEGMEIVL